MAADSSHEAPGPGAWLLDTSHLTTSCSTYHQPLFRDDFLKGFSGCLRTYGSLLESLDWEWVSGFPYFRLSPVGAPEGSTEHPPREAWNDLMASNLDIQERLGNAEKAFAERIWRDELVRWDTVDKPGAIEQNRRLLAVDPSSLDTAGLVDYIETCTRNVSRGVYLHHIYNMAAFIPPGDLIAEGTRLTGRSDAEILSLLQGSAPNALGTWHLRDRLASAMEKHPALRAHIDDGHAEAALNAISTIPDDAGDALREFVEFVAYRPVNGEDVGDTCAFEFPEVVIGALQMEIEGSGLHPAATNDEVAELTAEVRAGIAAEERDHFDDVLAEARHMYRIREERAMYGDLWSYGVARRALVAAGKRLVGSGRLESDTHLVEASSREIKAILEDTGGPDGAELAERALYRATVGFDEMPDHLGDPPGPHLPSEWLPDPSARMERALGAAVGALFGAPRDAAEVGPIEGIGVSPGVVEGPARVIDASSQFGRIRDGDILVTRATTAAFNVVLPLLRGIVTDRGGLLCHAAVVSREHSISAVVGTVNATTRIADGARVRVDGGSGQVTVLS